MPPTVCRNGLEGWLKLEIFTWPCKSGLAPHEPAGLEHKVASNAGGALDPRKQRDLRVIAGTADRYHRVEIKAPRLVPLPA